ncbi:cytochrome c oxidase subunit II [Cereibacter sphaeroides]|uniref:cytochrome c oxidase subunit II n=1 Tax=Rhodobacterales TaxID=204455 RepID=UPI000BBE3E44|nr:MULTISPECIES: cytochrome c oxidase subunit II [Paracoccaceae]MCE6951853.1 cytochrome c oxidase subunit II [Cereibacter sphaeroides]MCE6961165.1 cytochrome c oxidase subunit II [Cereibacter sphaeroides]MCE6970151.1 cytochrome c oxidase subunit II [Cereibacter sphaeroides]MCE6974110.1 cytochrome c oxidase subunit II [Cereibacter sphaeroides]
MRKSTTLTGSAVLASGALWAGVASAQQTLEIIGKPRQGEIGFQPAGGPLAAQIHWLDNFILVIIAAITLLVTVLILYAAWRFHERRNSVPARFTHNPPLEIAWTVVPIIILVAIGSFSLPALFSQQEIPEADVTVKVTGYQWYWGYEYPDEDVAFESYMIGSPATGGDNRLTPEVEAQLTAAGYSRDEFLLATDTAMVVPVNKTVVVQVTGADVIHAWTIPAFGVKQDAVPGRLAQLWFRAEREGVYFGQCSELCGIAHAYMPITVKVVSDEAYAAWLDQARGGTYELSALPPAAQPVAVE